MKNKNTIKIVIGVALVIVASLVVFLILKIKKPEEIKIGMTKEEVISIFDKNKYKYTIDNTSDECKIVTEDASIKNISGSLVVRILNDKVGIVVFLPNIDEKKKSQQIERLTKYLMNLYGDPYEEERQGSIYKHWMKDDIRNIRISFGYSLDENSETLTEIAWILQNMSKE